VHIGVARQNIDFLTAPSCFQSVILKRSRQNDVLPIRLFPGTGTGVEEHSLSPIETLLSFPTTLCNDLLGVSLSTCSLELHRALFLQSRSSEINNHIPG